jgi:hypothetical protein
MSSNLGGFMKLAFILLFALLASSSFADTKNCSKRDVQDYKDIKEYHRGEDGMPGITFLQGSKARDLYFKLKTQEISEGQDSFRKSGPTIECSKEVMPDLNCATYTCIIQEET